MQVLRKLFRHRLGLFGLLSIGGLLFLSVFGYAIAVDNSHDANNQCLPIKLRKPGFQCSFIQNSDTKSYWHFSELFFGKQVETPQYPIENNFYIRENWFYFKKLNQPFWERIHLDGLQIGKEREYKSRLTLIRKTFLFGTDGLGRDVLSRLIIGSRISLLVGLISVIISTFIGTILGLVAGYYGGIIDKFISWIIHIFWVVPTVLLAMTLLMNYQGRSSTQIYLVFLAVGLTMWVDTARLIRGLTLKYKEAPFIESAISLGYSDSRILCRHILPNTFSTLLVITASSFSSAILMESGLSYLGLGIQPPSPSWGSMLREYYNYLGTDVSYLAVFPGICIMIAVLSFYFLGNGLRDVLDIKNR